MICSNTTRKILEKSDIVKDCKFILYNSCSGYDCKIALNKRKMNRCRNCYFAKINFVKFAMSWL